MSLYEALVVAALVGVGGFAYRVYRKDTRPGGPGAADKPAANGELMFRRGPQSVEGDRE